MKFLNFLKKRRTDNFEALLQKAATEPAAHIELLKRLLTEKFLLITNSSHIPEGYYVVPEDTSIGVFTFDNGKTPFFSSEDRIFDNIIIKERVGFTELEGRDVFVILKGKTLMLNPFSKSNLELSPEETNALLNGTYLNTAGKAITVTASFSLDQPKRYPVEVIKSLVDFFSNDPLVETAYVGWIQFHDTDDHPHYIFAIDSHGDWNNLCKETGYIVNQILGGEIFDLIQLRIQKDIEEYFLKTGNPFYMKSV